MKKLLLQSALIIIITFSCVKPESPVITDPEIDSFITGNGVFIINEGNFLWGNGALSYYSYDSSKLYNDAFMKINNRPLGDVPNSMVIHGDNGYIIVNNSGKVEVVKRNTLKSVTTITGLDSPRNIGVIDNTKAYVTSMFSNSVAILNLKLNTITGYIDLGNSSESIIISGKKALVSSWIANNKVFVIDTDTDQVTMTIEAGIEPESMVVDKNFTLWVLCNGGWARENFAELVGISVQTGEILKRFPFPSKLDSPTSLQINGEGDMLYYLRNGVWQMSINSGALPASPFINEEDHLFYKLGINPVNGDILVTDAVDYQKNGYLLFYKKNGTFTASWQTNIIPGSMCFKVQPNPNIE